MRIPVFVALPSNPDLIHSAERVLAKERFSFRSPLDTVQVPEGIELNPRFPAIPLGIRRLDNAGIESFRPRASEWFLLEAFVDAPGLWEVPEEIGGVPLFSNPKIKRPSLRGTGDSIGTSQDVSRALRVPDLAAQGLDGTNVAIAIVDEGVGRSFLSRKLPTARVDWNNSWSNPSASVMAGAMSSYHGDTSAFDAVLSAGRATLLDCPALLVRGDPTISETEQLLSGPAQVFSWLLQKWAVLKDSLSQYNGLVISNSWGVPNADWDFNPAHSGNYVGNPQHPFNLLVTSLANAGADILFAAGNCGPACADPECNCAAQFSIMGANALPAVLCMGAVDTRNRWLNFSSQGPSISNMAPNKPDLTAYAQFLGADISDDGTIPDIGTSAACAVAAGCVAALRTKWNFTQLSPLDLFAALRAHATPVGSATGWDRSVGFGIINPLATAAALP